jgi:hypothetical protein
MKNVTERVRKQLRASWRFMLVSMLRLTYRAQDRLEQRLIKQYEANPTR